MRNVLLIQLETKVSLAVLLIVVAIFLIVLFKGTYKLNEFIENLNTKTFYETAGEY